jgi:hypothetical protein
MIIIQPSSIRNAFVDARNRIDIFSGEYAQFRWGAMAAHKLVDVNVSISAVLVRRLNDTPRHLSIEGRRMPLLHLKHFHIERPAVALVLSIARNAGTPPPALV